MNIKDQKDNKEKEKTAREILSKYFFSLSLATYTGAVMGVLASMLGLLNGDTIRLGPTWTSAIFIVGSALTVVFAIVGNKISRGK